MPATRSGPPRRARPRSTGRAKATRRNHSRNLPPDIDSVELCCRLRELDDVPILVLSSVDDQQAKIDAFESGADDYVTKPFGPESSWLDSRRGCGRLRVV